MDSNYKIRRLNDNLRKYFLGGKVRATQGVLALPKELQSKLFDQVESFNDWVRLHKGT